MKRRSLLKALSVMGTTGWAMGPNGVIAPAYANVSKRKQLNARAQILDKIGYSKPSTMPQVISIFMYGGPSELGANLTNMEELNAVSLNKYSETMEPGNEDTIVTKNGFWGSDQALDADITRGAGGQIMERMMKAKRLSIYRTLNRVIDDSKAHRSSIFSNLTGKVGEDDLRPGIGSNIATILHANNAIADDATFPFVTMEGDSLIYNTGELSVPLRLKPLSLDQNLRNPYQRDPLSGLDSTEDKTIDDLAKEAMEASSSRYGKVIDAFTKRSEMASFIEELSDKIDNGDLPNDPDFPADGPDSVQLQYPNENQNPFSKKLKSAVQLMINNSDTLFTSLSTGGLGGWDDHNDAIAEYSERLRELMATLEVAAKHIEASGNKNIVIVVYGEFGRNANLNGSLGWDHGNNQNFYIIGPSQTNGSEIPSQELGKLVGKTKLKGTAENNRLYTTPTEDSYQCEPFAVAATLYNYFGIENPEELTGGIDPIDQTGTTNEWVDPTA